MITQQYYAPPFKDVFSSVVLHAYRPHGDVRQHGYLKAARTGIPFAGFQFEDLPKGSDTPIERMNTPIHKVTVQLKDGLELRNVVAAAYDLSRHCEGAPVWFHWRINTIGVDLFSNRDRLMQTVQRAAEELWACRSKGTIDCTDPAAFRAFNQQPIVEVTALRPSPNPLGFSYVLRDREPWPPRNG